MSFTTLVDPETLATHLHDPQFVVVDCRFKLDDEDWGAREHGTRRVPGAIFGDVNRDLAGSKTGLNGRHPLPDADAVARTLGRWGITRGVQVIAYDQDASMYAARLWWLLRWLGHSEVAVLDGGFARWTAEGRETESGPASANRPGRVFLGQPDPGMIVDSTFIARVAGQAEWRLLDARAPERFRGDSEPIDPVPGHIPSAVNRPFLRNVIDGGRFLPVEELRTQLEEVLGGVPPDHTACYCGSGVTACQVILALEHAGLRGAKLYPGSWSEWVSDRSRPVARGD